MHENWGQAGRITGKMNGGYVARARILLADDHDEMRDKVKRLLECDFEVIDSVENGLTLLEAAARLNPDVCVLDISMPLLNGIETASRLRQAGSTAKIVFLTVHESVDFVQAALETGASGFVVKRRMASELRRAINEALAGRIFVSSSIALPTGQSGDAPPARS